MNGSFGQSCGRNGDAALRTSDRWVAPAAKKKKMSLFHPEIRVNLKIVFFKCFNANIAEEYVCG